MKKNYLNLSIAVLIAAGISSCGKKKEENNVTAVVSQEQATTTINSSAERTYTDIVDLTSSEGVETLKNIDNLMSGENGSPFRLAEETNKEKVLAKIKEYRDFFLPSNKTIAFGRTAEDRFDFAANKGTYVWNKTTEDWDKQADSATATTIVMQFPSDSTKSTNDATLTISKYTDIAITNDGETEYMPTAISAALTVNSVKQVGLELTASYNAITGNPTALKAALFLKPFTLNSDFSISGSVVTLTSSIDKEGEANHVMSEGISVTMGDVANMENPKKINNAYVQCRDLKLEGSLDVENFENDTTGSLTNRFNKYAVLNLNSYPAGDRLANVKMVESTDPSDNSTKNDLYIIFNNGQKELMETFFKKHVDKISDFMENELSLK